MFMHDEEEEFPAEFNERIKRDRTRTNTVDRAMEAAESILLKETDGSFETLLWLTSQMALKYQEKTMTMVSSLLNKKELMKTSKVTK